MRRLLSVFLLALLALPAQAEVPLSGSFTATKACPALQSIRRQTNPGNVSTLPGQSYELRAANSDHPSHYWIVIPGAQPDARWVSLDCGKLAGAAATNAAPSPGQRTSRGPQYVLAINWQPAFCETSPGKRECRNQRSDSFEATHFTLHGLWPQPRDHEYCNVSPRDRTASQSGDWRDLPAVELDPALRRDLDIAMPGTRSQLERHEWTRHGSCYGASQAAYFSDALDLLLAVNTSPVAELFARNIGRKITLRQVRAAFDGAFGSGAGLRVSMSCAPDGNRQIITELTLALSGSITGPDALPALLLAADPARDDCTAGMVDAVGLR